MKTIIKNHELLSEESRTIDLFDYGPYAKDLKLRIDEMPDIAIIALVGPYGIGKTVLLNIVNKDISLVERWFQFDAWKYPDKQDLWEGFILDF